MPIRDPDCLPLDTPSASTTGPQPPSLLSADKWPPGGRCSSAAA